MTLYVADKKVQKIYRGTELIQKAMLGSVSNPVWGEKETVSKPELDAILFDENTAGTYSITIPITAKYEVTFIGAGGGCACTHSSYYYAAGGGSGAGFVGVVELPKGEYTISVGKGGAKGTAYRKNAYGSSGGFSYLKYGNTYLIRAFGGSGGQVSWSSATEYSFYPGSGGSKPVITAYTPTGEEVSMSSLNIISTTLNSAGKSGSKNWDSSTLGVLGGSPVDGTFGTGHGAGGSCTTTTPTDGKSGYAKIVYKGE